MDDKSLADVEQEDKGWYGQLPCVCHSHRGCHEHNPNDWPIYYDSTLPPVKRPGFWERIVSSLWHSPQPPAEEEDPTGWETDPRPSSVFWTELPFDTGTVATIPPMHPTMPYHLAYYHLDCARQYLDTSKRISLISGLTCSGAEKFHPRGLGYTWSNDIYFSDGTFLQKQEIRCVVDERSVSSSARTIRLNGCRHTTLAIWGLAFRRDRHDELLEGRLRWSESRVRPGGGHFLSEYGRFNTREHGFHCQFSPCEDCHTDLETFIELIGDELHIRYTCYRDLGPATQRFTSRWNAAVTGKGYTRSKKDVADIYPTVWRAAKTLGRIQ